MSLPRFFAACAAISVLGAGLAAATPSQAAGQVHHTTTVRTVRNGHVVRTVRTTHPAVVHHVVRPLHHRVVVAHHKRYVHHR